MTDLNALAEAIIKGDGTAAVQITRTAIGERVSPKSILDEGLVAGMEVIGTRFSKNEIFVPEVMFAARAMKAAMALLEPELVKAGVKPIGRFLIGTVKGDMHDIGKNLVVMMLKGAGFEVIDLGTDVSPDRFVEHAGAKQVQLVGMSTLLTTSMPSMDRTLKALRAAGLSAKVLIGGAPVTQAYADKIGAQGYATNAAEAVELAKRLIA